MFIVSCTSEASWQAVIHEKILPDTSVLTTLEVRSLQTVWQSSNNPTQNCYFTTRYVLSVLIYNAETWSLREEDKRKLRDLETAALRRISGYSFGHNRHYESIRDDHGLDVDKSSYNAD